MGNWIVTNVTFVSVVAASPLKQPTSLFARGQSGKVSTREFNTKGWVWEETYRGRMADPDMQAFLTRMTRAVTKGEILSGKKHPGHKTLLGDVWNLPVCVSGPLGTA